MDKLKLVFDESHRTTFEDCNNNRCRVVELYGQCHMRRHHKGNHDPFGESHIFVRAREA